jgi:hypothetical protein
MQHLKNYKDGHIYVEILIILRKIRVPFRYNPDGWDVGFKCPTLKLLKTI